MERHGINAVVTPLVNELNELSKSGIEIIQNESKKHTRQHYLHF